MYVATQFEWSAVRDFHATVLLEIERGSLTWGESFAHLEQQVLIGKLKSRPSPAIRTTRALPPANAGVLFCRDFNRGLCHHEKDHYGAIKGIQKWLQHICAKCWTTNRKVDRHSEYATDCPLFSVNSGGAGPTTTSGQK
jgi:hypothetical protein